MFHEDFAGGFILGGAFTTLLFIIGALLINGSERETCIQVTGAEDCVQVWRANP